MLSTTAAGTPAAELTDRWSIQLEAQNASTTSATQRPSDNRSDYVNLRPQQRIVPAAPTRPSRDYANLSLSAQQLDVGSESSAKSNPSASAEQNNPRLNYMELDFSTGRGQPCRPQLGQRLAYVELDFRAMSALAATVQAERDLAPICSFTTGGASGRRGFVQSSEDSPASQPAKTSSLGRLRSSVAKSLSRFSLRRRGRRE